MEILEKILASILFLLVLSTLGFLSWYVFFDSETAQIIALLHLPFVIVIAFIFKQAQDKLL